MLNLAAVAAAVLCASTAAAQEETCTVAGFALKKICDDCHVHVSNDVLIATPWDAAAALPLIAPDAVQVVLKG